MKVEKLDIKPAVIDTGMWGWVGRRVGIGDHIVAYMEYR